MAERYSLLKRFLPAEAQGKMATVLPVGDSPADSLAALKTALFELLVLKEELKLKEAQLQGFRRSQRRLSRVRRTIERQTIGLASDLRGEDVAISEISRLLRAASETARAKQLLISEGAPQQEDIPFELADTQA